jgi:hypothetical protein
MAKHSGSGPKFMFPCDLCGSKFQFGPHVYDGKHIASYQLTVCRSCWESNHDGWAPGLEDVFLAHLKAKGIAVPTRNAQGWFPRE